MESVVAHKTANRDPVGMDLATRCALDLEGVVEGRVLGIFWLKIGDTATCELQAPSPTCSRLPVELSGER